MSMPAAIETNLVETFTSPTNIAVIKYWGKGDVKLNTPMNSSVSLTLDQSDLHTVTSIGALKEAEKDRMWLNGTEIEINKRGLTCLAEIRKLAQERVDSEGNVIVKKEEWADYKVHIVSINTFPTGAGLASSAAGLACFVSALAKLYNVKEKFPGQLTAIARQGSGSASRSMYGGLVRWNKGIKKDGTDSIAQQIADENFWPEMRAVILVVSDKEKDTSSTSGMETSRLTSPLLAHRASSVVQPRLEQLEKAYLDKDFETFGQLTMKDSNQFHAICQDTYPPIFYMNDVSKSIIRLCSIINEHYEKVVAAYTFDAGPNAVIYCLDESTPMIMAAMSKYFPAPGATADYCNNAEAYDNAHGSLVHLPPELDAKLQKCGRAPASGDVKYMFLTKVGCGPIAVSSAEESVLDLETGMPKPNKVTDIKHKRMTIGVVRRSSVVGMAATKAKEGAAAAASAIIGVASAGKSAAGSVGRAARQSLSGIAIPSFGSNSSSSSKADIIDQTEAEAEAETGESGGSGSDGASASASAPAVSEQSTESVEDLQQAAALVKGQEEEEEEGEGAVAQAQA